MGLLTQEVAVVTGAASGLGAAIARLFIDEGARVVLTDISAEAGSALAQELGENARFHPLNVTQEEDWAKVVAFSEKEFGPITVMVNNAGISDQAPIEEMDVARFRRSVDINEVALLLSYRAVVPSMKKAGRGSIVNISSIMGMKGGATSIAYSGTKFAVRGMTRSAALELIPHNIRVNSIHPGGMNTAMVEQTRKLHPGAIEAFEAAIPIKRMADPVEVAKGVLFFASSMGSYCVGSELVMDGGSIA